MKKIINILVVSMFSLSSFADSKAVEVKADKDVSNVVSWEGYIVAGGGHTTRHDHSIEFVRKSDGKTFNVKNSPELEQIHCDTSTKLLVKIEAEKTPRFLFWGGNLIVKNFEVLEELDVVAHQIYVPTKAIDRAFDRR